MEVGHSEPAFGSVRHTIVPRSRQRKLDASALVAALPNELWPARQCSDQKSARVHAPIEPAHALRLRQVGVIILAVIKVKSAYGHDYQDSNSIVILPLIAFAFRFLGRAPPNGRPTVRPIATPPRPEGARSSVSDDASGRFRGDFFGRFFFVAI